MTYSPGRPGYPSGPYGAASPPAPSFARSDDAPSSLSLYLTGAVVLLGLAAYLASFGPMFTISADLGPFGGELSGTGGFFIPAALLASGLAAASLLPKAKSYAAVVAVVAMLSALLVISQVVGKPSGFSIGWGLWAVLGFVVLQALVAVGALLLEAGVITPPAARPSYDQYGQYGPPPSGYYGQPGAQPHAPHQQPSPGQRPGYPSQYGNYPSGPSTGGFNAPGQAGSHQAPQHGSPTPPTGFPSFSPPPAAGSGPQDQGSGSSGQGHAQPPSSAPSGPALS